MRSMSALPPSVPASGPGSPPANTSARLPWEDRAQLGFFEALVQTLRLLVTRPGDGFSRLRPDGDLASPLLFGILVSWMFMLVSQVWSLVMSSALEDLFGGISELDALFQSPSVWGIAATTVLWPFFFVVVAFLGSAILHGSMMIVGGTAQSKAGFEGTLKVFCYASVSGMGQLIPIAGGIVAMLWSFILHVTGLATVHDAPQGRALAAVLIPSFVCCACAMGTAAMFGAMLASAFEGFSWAGGLN